MFAYLFGRCFAVPAVVVLESVSAGGAMRRSWHLSRGRVGKILGTLLLAWLVFGVAFIALALIGQLFGGLSRVLASVVASVASCLAYPIISIVSMLLYYDARVVKEGLDIELMTHELEGGRLAPTIP